MNFIVDTCVWSLALRRRNLTSDAAQTAWLIQAIQRDESIYLLGIILQELLQGIRDEKHGKKTMHQMAQFPLLEPSVNDHIYAAKASNQCRSNGIHTGTIDCLIAAMAISNHCQLVTIDRDFTHMSTVIPLKLLKW